MLRFDFENVGAKTSNVKTKQRGSSRSRFLFKNSFQRCLADLDDKHREVFSLRHEDALSIKEIADVLEISDGTVKSRLFYATKYLAESLKEFNPTLNR